MSQEIEKKRQETIREAIKDAFRQRPLLASMIQDRLGESLDSITYNESNYDLAIRALVEWVDSEGRLQELIVGALRDKPMNNKLRELILNYPHIIFNLNENTTTEEDFCKLFLILEKLPNKNLIHEVLFEVLKTEDLDEGDIIGALGKNVIEDLKQVQANSSFRKSVVLQLHALYRIFDLFPYNSENNLPYILFFAERLKDRVKLFKKLAGEIDSWCENFARQKKFEWSARSNDTSEVSEVDFQEASLMIILKSVGERKKEFSLNAFLRLYKHHKDGRQEELPIPLISLGQVSRKGKVCQLKQIKTHIQALIDESLGKIGAIPMLVIEVFLPIDLLNASLELLASAPDDPQPIGKRYRFVLRSEERLSTHAKRIIFEKAWNEKYKPQLEKLESEKDVPCCVEFLHEPYIKRWDSLPALEVYLERHPKAILKMTSRQDVKFFDAVIRSGVPCIFWTRCDQPLTNYDDWNTVLDKFLTLNSLKNRSIFLEMIRKEREDAYAAGAKAKLHLGHHLALLFDDPNRFPKEYEMDKSWG